MKIQSMFLPLALAFVSIAACGSSEDTSNAPESSGNDAGAKMAGAFPFSGPSCSSGGPNTGQMPKPECMQCASEKCADTFPCIESACADYYGCFCACPNGDASCYLACQPKLTNE